MILLDTTVVIEYLRSPSPALRDVFARETLAITGITRAEVLHGARNNADTRRLTLALDGFTQIVLAHSIWDKLGIHLSLLRAHGIAVPFQDALISTIAIDEDLRLWTLDSHFAHIQQVLPNLRLFSQPA